VVVQVRETVALAVAVLVETSRVATIGT
jgi:hypothetical protein